jgi:hypothetical protein
MGSVSRKAVRDGVTGLLAAALVGEGKPAQAVYGYQVGDFEGQSPVVVVTSGPMARTRRGIGACWHSAATLLVFVFVAYADAAAGWSEADAEDALDAIEALIADVVLVNGSSGTWHGLTYAEATEPDGVEIGGVGYRREVIRLRCEVLGDGV